MEEDILLIKRVKNLLDNIYSYDDINAKCACADENFQLFLEFKYSLGTILRNYQFNEVCNKEQNEICELLKENIIRILRLQDVFENTENLNYYKSEILDDLKFNEGRFAFNLQYNKTIENSKSALHYLNVRKEYVQAIKDCDCFKGESLNEGAARGYIDSEYEKNVLGHVLITIKENITRLPKDDVTDIIKSIDNSTIFDGILSKDESKLNFYEKNLLYQYTQTILKLKSIFDKDSLIDDKVTNAMWNGKIKNGEILESTINNTTPLLWKYFLDNGDNKEQQKEEQRGFFENFANHLKSVGLENYTISLAERAVLDQYSSYKEVAKLLEKIDIPDDYKEFMESEKSQNFEWLKDRETFERFKNYDKKIEKGYHVMLPVDYYLKKIEKMNYNLNDTIVSNLITLIHSGYYNDEESNKLKQAIIDSGCRKSIFSGGRVNFQNITSKEQLKNKINTAYLIGQNIPYDILNLVLKKSLAGKYDITSLQVQACVKSLISDFLNNTGIKCKVFFGYDNSYNGYANYSDKCIWINKSLINDFIKGEDMTERTKLFDTMFHEMRHMVQNKWMEDGELNYLNYNFIKEDIIMDNDPDFYSENYKDIYLESDARRHGILKQLSMLKILDKEILESIKSSAKDKYKKEVKEYSLYKTSSKKMSLGKDNKLDISDYVSYLIEANPEILDENPLLEIEYNKDGSKKSVDVLLNELEIKKQDSSINYESMYSIYYGIIYNEVNKNPVVNEKLKERVDKFLESAKDIISTEQLQNFYHEVEGKDSEKYKNLYNIVGEDELLDTNSESKNKENKDFGSR